MGSFGTGTFGSGRFGATFDNFADPGVVIISPSPYGTFVSDPVSNIGFTQEAGEPDPVSNGYRSAWWRYTTPAVSLTVTFDTRLMDPGNPDLFSTAKDTKLSVWTGSTVDALTLVGFNDDDPAGDTYASLVTVDLAPGTTYWIRVGCYDISYDQNYVLRATTTAPAAPAIDVTTELEYGYPVNDYLIAAYPVTVPSFGGTYTSAAIPTIGLSEETGENTLAGATICSAWWTFTPVADGTATIDTELSASGADTYLQVCTLPAGQSLAVGHLSEVVHDDDSGVGSTSKLSMGVTAGTTYYIRVSTFITDPIDQAYVLRVAYVVPAPPIDLQARFYHLADTVSTSGPAVDVEVVIPVPDTTVFTVLAVQPAAGTVVPTETPTYKVAVRQRVGTATTALVEIQVDPGLGLPIQDYTANITLSTGLNTASVQGAFLGVTNVAWRARVTLAGITSPWSAWIPFTVDTAGALAFDTPMAWTVAAGTAAPQIWFVVPGSGVPGSVVTVYGQGLTTATGTATVGGLPATVHSWTRVADSGASTSRVIDAVYGRADCEHFEVTITVPDVAAPGGALILGD